MGRSLEGVITVGGDAIIDKKPGVFKRYSNIVLYNTIQTNAHYVFDFSSYFKSKLW
jgi:hypothetical protein